MAGVMESMLSSLLRKDEQPIIAKSNDAAAKKNSAFPGHYEIPPMLLTFFKISVLKKHLKQANAHNIETTDVAVINRS